MDIQLYDLETLSPTQRTTLLRRAEVDIAALQDTVRPILGAVRDRGDAALLEFTERFDGVTLTADQLRVTDEEFERARNQIDPAVREAIEVSAANIRKFHEAQMPEDLWFTEVGPGILAGEKVTPIASLGLYVPRGKGSFPSVMMMLATPASVAKVPRVVVVTPPTPEGTLDDATLVAAELCGIREVYKVGGSQAIAALAYGTESVPRVDKVLGPGNQYVSAAKRLLYGTIDVGTPAGPSESIVLADEHANPDIAALDLLIEAEHGPDSAALLVTPSRQLAEAVCERLPALVEALPEPRRDFCTRGLATYGGIVVAPDLDAALDFVNEFAPEHLEVLVEEPMAVLPKIVNAGEILLGENTPITIGNFSLGVNAILPTGGFAKTFSCVTVFDFLKRSSIGYLTREGYERLAPVARTLAEIEGFPAHARALTDRPFGARR